MRAKDVLGRSGEQAAAEYLESCGLRILDRNWRCAAGEIDQVYAHLVISLQVVRLPADLRATPAST